MCSFQETTCSPGRRSELVLTEKVTWVGPRHLLLVLGPGMIMHVVTAHVRFRLLGS